MAKKDYKLVPAADKGADLYMLDEPMLNETGKPLAYPFGFEPTLHKYRMDYPGKLKMGNNIFVGAMSDVFGAWVPDSWLEDIFAVCEKHPIHNYLFLTKNPERYERIDSAGILPADGNMWYGTTLTRPEDKCFVSNTHNTFWSIEPIFAPFQLWEKDAFSPDWIIIGAETGCQKKRIIPQNEWIEDIAGWCEKSKIPVFMKDSLIPIVGADNMRREYPKGLMKKAVSPKMEKKLYDSCVSCKAHMEKRMMVALSARSKRGEQPKQFGFMCRQCFMEFWREKEIEVPQLTELKSGKEKL